MRALLERGLVMQAVDQRRQPERIRQQDEFLPGGVQILPTMVMNSMPLIHSPGVKFTSRAKACRCFTAAAMISFMRGSGVVAI